MKTIINYSIFVFLGLIAGCGLDRSEPFSQGTGIFCERGKPLISPDGTLLMMINKYDGEMPAYGVSLQPWEPDGNWIYSSGPLSELAEDLLATWSTEGHARIYINGSDTFVILIYDGQDIIKDVLSKAETANRNPPKLLSEFID